jgi:hypothetical protein
MKIALAFASLAAFTLPAAADPVPDEQVVGPGDTAPAPVVEVVPSAANPVEAENPCGHWRGWHQRPVRGRFALGFSKGHLGLDDDREATQKSLIARVALRRGWEIELEMAKMELDGDDTHSGGASLVRAFGKHGLRPYVIAGVGGGQIERADGGERHLRYAEVGAGLMLRGRRLAIGADVRRGARQVDEADAPMAKMTTADDDRERYVRGRILALVYF